MTIGITGTNGAGKGTVVDYLVQKGFTHYSARDFLTAEAKRRGLPINRNSMRETGNSLRKEYGSSFIAEQLFAQAQATGGDAVIESVRSLGEADFLRENGVVLFAVNADRKLRYERSARRGSRTDDVSFETWVAQEEREWHNEATHDMNVPGVMALADYIFENNGSLEELHKQVDAQLRQAKK